MNAPEKNMLLPDVQSSADVRGIEIGAVGIQGLRYPIKVRSGGQVAATVAQWAMTVTVPAAVKGTHMSRFVELLQAQSDALDAAGFRALLRDMLGRLNAQAGTIEMRFPWFVEKTAPVSGVRSLLDHDVQWRASVSAQGQQSLWLKVVVPVTSLCPCSREISVYGAHNQRSHIAIEVEVLEPIEVEDLIAIAERSSSCEVYGLLKRADEKYVTERAYENPKFVEDMVRDVAAALNQERRVGAYAVEVENFETIHNHSAFARIARPARGPVEMQASHVAGG